MLGTGSSLAQDSKGVNRYFEGFATDLGGGSLGEREAGEHHREKSGRVVSPKEMKTPRMKNGQF